MLVAHNAPFDLGFLKAACTTTGRDVARLRLRRHRPAGPPRPHPRRGAQLQVVHAGKAFPYEGHPVPPCPGRCRGHRRRAARPARPARQPRRPVPRRAAHLLRPGHRGPAPQAPPRRGRSPTRRGSTCSSDERGKVLYVGKSKDLRTRVRNYFVASENRTRMSEMVGLAERVDHIACAPPRSRPRCASCGSSPSTSRATTVGRASPSARSGSRSPTSPSPAYPPSARCATTGPPTSAPSALKRLGREGAHRAPRLVPGAPVHGPAVAASKSSSSACVLAEMGRCGAPCDGTETVEQYAVHVEAVRVAITVSPREVVEGFERRMAALAGQPDATRTRPSTATGSAPSSGPVPACSASSMLAGCRELVAAQPTRRPRLGPPRRTPRSARRRRCGAARRRSPALRRRPRGHRRDRASGAQGRPRARRAEEMECVLRWLDVPGTRLVELDGVWASPRPTAPVGRSALVPSSRDGVDPFADRRGLRPGPPADPR